MTDWLTLSDLPPADQEAIVAVADEAEQSGDAGPLERALAGGDLLGDRDPVHVPPDPRTIGSAAIQGAMTTSPRRRGCLLVGPSAFACRARGESAHAIACRSRSSSEV
jgi:hypothetical protein